MTPRAGDLHAPDPPMTLTGSSALDDIDWHAVEDLFRCAPLGGKGAAHLGTVPGQEAFHRKLGFSRLLTAMAIFEDEAAARARGHLGDG